MRGSFHESFEGKPAPRASDKSFCLTFAVVFTLAAFLVADSFRIASFGLALAFVLLAYARPHAATPLNRAWQQFGTILHRITNPVLLTLLYAIAILPLGMAMRLLGRNRTPAPDPMAQSYWQPRETPEPQSMRNQF